MEPTLDIVTIFIFLGVIQALFLGFFFTRRAAESVSNVYFGLLLVSVAAIIFEMMLGYSGYITRVIHLVDFAEPLNFTLGPLLYLALRTRVRGESFSRRQLLHLIPFVLYALYHLPYMFQSADFKEIAWLEAWRAQDSDAGGALVAIDVDPLRIRRIVAELTIVHALCYIAASLRTLAITYRERGLSFWSRDDAELSWWRRFVFQFLAILIVVGVVKVAFPNDLGDYIIAIVATAIVYAASWSVISRSSFFSIPRGGRKYEKSALTPELRDTVLARLSDVMEKEKPHLQPSITLASLASRVNVSPHHLSQVLNEGAGCTFHDYLARHRIEEARKLLSEPDNQSLRIEDIAERVGYYSKSSFNTAFRRIVGVTPSKYRSSQES